MSERKVLISGKDSRGEFLEYLKDSGRDCDRWMNNATYSF